MRRATNVFGARAARGLGAALPRKPNMAVFKIRFAESRRERTVTIRAPAMARYDRSEDCELIERWLRAQGFLLPRDLAEDEHTEAGAVLERA